jgi:hypothetical protein
MLSRDKEYFWIITFSSLEGCEILPYNNSLKQTRDAAKKSIVDSIPRCLAQSRHISPPSDVNSRIAKCLIVLNTISEPQS